MDPLELTAVIFGAVAVWLTAKENILCWPLGLVNVSLYVVIFYRVKLYADMGLQVVYIVLILYGWYSWLHGGRDRGELIVTRTPARLWVILLVVGALFAVLLGTTLHRSTDASLPYVDSLTTSFSLVAQFMSARKLLENWIVWIVVDVIYIWMYIVKDLRLTAVLYAIFLVLAFVGFRDWRRSIVRQAANA